METIHEQKVLQVFLMEIQNHFLGRNNWSLDIFHLCFNQSLEGLVQSCKGGLAAAWRRAALGMSLMQFQRL